MTKAMPDIPDGANIVTPQPGPQTQFVSCPADICFFGGSAGGGKTYGLLFDPLYHINNPKFGAVIFRRTMAQVLKEGSLWDSATELYGSIGGTPFQSPNYRYVFPSKMQVAFTHLEHEKNKLDYQGSQMPWIGFDEITHFSWGQFSYIVFSRGRSSAKVGGTKIRATCNPDPDHWVRKWIDWWIGEDGLVIPERSGMIRWFIHRNDETIWADSKQEIIDRFPEDHKKGILFPMSFTFIRSSIYDNKIMLQDDPSSLAKLHNLPRIERAQLLEGNWNTRPTAGGYFQRSDFEVVDAVPAGARRVRAWDLAGTDRDSEDKALRKAGEPAYTVGVKIAKVKGCYYIEDVARSQIDASKVLSYIKNVASQDGRNTNIRLPQDPGQAGKSQAKHFVRELAGYYVKAYPVSGSKEARANPLAAQAQAGNVKLVRGPWIDAFLNEATNFPEGKLKDQIDAAADAFDELTNKKRVGTW